ncbi:hypothetical protein EB093_09220 [bacterium]|nr:hypothetical protein [bacterium]
MKIAVLIPSTSKGREWGSVKDSYLYIHTLKTFILTYDKEHEYRFYIGIDRSDRIYDNPEVKQYLERMMAIIKNTSIEFVYMDGIDKGHLTVMWNRLFQKAYDDAYDYFFQCGDDIEFRTNGWVNDCIQTLESAGGMGMTGPINNNARILTQSFVSRMHMELFGYYFPVEIVNWCCDDWINEVYINLSRFYPLKQHCCVNVGGNPRYDINNEPNFTTRRFNERLVKLRTHSSQLADRDARRAVEKLKSLSV